MVRESLVSVISVPPESAMSVIFTDYLSPPASSASCNMTGTVTCPTHTLTFVCLMAAAAVCPVDPFYKRHLKQF